VPIIPHTTLEAFGASMLAAAGLPDDQAQIASHHLVEANLMGHDSHGIIRVPTYAASILKGDLKPVGSQKTVRETPASLVWDANRSFGIVLAYTAMQEAVNRAREHTFGAVAVHRSGHIGRLGAYPPLAADKDCIGVVMLNGGARFTAPYGGVGRRLPPNPIAISVPVENGAHLMLDITTSVAAGGKVDVMRARGKTLPEGWLIDDAGQSVDDPRRFWEDNVAMLPLGGPFGYKGYGLAMMIDAIAGGLSWAGCSSAAPTRGGSGYIALAMMIEAFIDPNEFKREVRILVDWVKSSPTMPGFDKIYVPGEIEDETLQRRTKEGLNIEDATWDALQQAASDLKVAVPTF
jgi:LDH2 family malate/lactate/ureidoglycolate dehydrogenase